MEKRLQRRIRSYAMELAMTCADVLRLSEQDHCPTTAELGALAVHLDVCAGCDLFWCGVVDRDIKKNGPITEEEHAAIQARVEADPESGVHEHFGLK